MSVCAHDKQTDRGMSERNRKQVAEEKGKLAEDNAPITLQSKLTVIKIERQGISIR